MAQESRKSILILLPDQPGLPAATLGLAGIRSTLVATWGTGVSIYPEHVDLERFPGTDHEQRLRDGFHAKYAGLTLDGIVAFGPTPLRFLIRWGHDLWPGVPAVAAGVDEVLLTRLDLPPSLTAIPMRYDVEGTVRLALQLLPDTRRVALVSGVSPMEYFGGRPGEDRWFEMQVRRLGHAGGEAVIVHRDITERKRAEDEARRILGTMAHLERVAAVGELASALAHELNQPLTAILANAQTAQEWLATPSPDLAELRDTMDDIVAENIRASEVIRRMRAMLKKGELPGGCVPTPVGGVEYYYCGGNFYRAMFQGNTLVYVTAKP